MLKISHARFYGESELIRVNSRLASAIPGLFAQGLRALTELLTNQAGKVKRRLKPDLVGNFRDR